MTTEPTPAEEDALGEALKQLDEWWRNRMGHDVPGQGGRDVLSLANVLRMVLTYLIAAENG